jgi:hypothetical protein
MKQRATTVSATLGAVLLLATACGQARAGTAVPKGDDAAAYVSAKFEGVMGKLGDTLGTQWDTTTTYDTYFRFDDKWVRSTITSARLGSPEARVSHVQSQKNPDDLRDYFDPADGTVNYTHLGPTYKSLAPTSWVSMPKPEAGNGPPCAWSGILPACYMASAVSRAFNANKKAVTSARTLPDGKIEVAASVPLSAFFEARVEVLPDSIMSQISDATRKEIVPTKVTISADGTLSQITMEATISGDNHKIELREDFRFTGKATPQDFPQTPAPADVTVLPDRPAVDDFYRRMTEITGR